ncbi:hypothetical protein HON36_05555 [Candidatus Parcubacteria bacterium]|jgi:hypothetical protein|nr:hypothetical protein [Candidatus Parcubacteria bacterium]MBT7227934.1 hypothetical protein [Candidatus Parcubacteria bacterium]
MKLCEKIAEQMQSIYALRQEFVDAIEDGKKTKDFKPAHKIKDVYEGKYVKTVYKNIHPYINLIFLAVTYLSREGKAHGKKQLSEALNKIEVKGEAVHVPYSLTVGNKTADGPSDIMILPDDLVVDGDLDIWSYSIEKLPSKLKVKGDLNISGTTITEIPKGIEIGGDCKMQKTNIHQLPLNFKIKGDLDIRSTQIAWLPKGLHVGGSVYAQATGIDTIVDIPDDVVIEGDLHVRNKFNNNEALELKNQGIVKGEVYNHYN